MVMTSRRRVKRVKRSKKYLHHERRKTSRRRYTRIQRGGKTFEVCKSTGLIKKSGITIKYDDETQTYMIGSEPYAELQKKPRYENAIRALDDLKKTTLTTREFETFKTKYCSTFPHYPRECDQIKKFVPPTAFAAPASATDTDSKKILIKQDGVHFGSIFKPWSANSCTFDDNKEPFTKYVFTTQKHTIPPSLRVTFVMSSNVKTFCALEKYASTMNDPTIDYSLISPSVTITLNAQWVESWNIADDVEMTYRKILSLYDSCEEPYTGLYEFYQDKNPVIATFFFTKLPEVVYDPIVYQNHISKLIKSCADQTMSHHKSGLFKLDDVSTIVGTLEKFKAKLQTMIDDPKALKQLDNDVNVYVRETFQRLLVQTQKGRSLAVQMSQMSIGAAATP